MVGKRYYCLRLFSARLYDFLPCDTHRARWRLVRVRLQMYERKWRCKGEGGQVFSETTNRGRAEGKSWIVVCTSCSSCTLDSGVIHLVDRCINPCPVISADYLQIDVFESHVAMLVPRHRLLSGTISSCSSIYMYMRKAIQSWFFLFLCILKYCYFLLFLLTKCNFIKYLKILVLWMLSLNFINYKIALYK